jgi:hypothetical protein
MSGKDKRRWTAEFIQSGIAKKATTPMKIVNIPSVKKSLDAVVSATHTELSSSDLPLPT